jgi:hypothetical protein
VLDLQGEPASEGQPTGAVQRLAHCRSHPFGSGRRNTCPSGEISVQPFAIIVQNSQRQVGDLGFTAGYTRSDPLGRWAGRTQSTGLPGGAAPTTPRLHSDNR